MSLVTAVSGQFNLVRETNNQPFVGFNLAEVFPPLTGVEQQTYYERELKVADGVVPIALGGVQTVRGFILQVVGNDPVVVKNDGNANGITVNKGLMLFGSLSAITIETASTAGVTVKILLFQ